ncbi:M15 family metallopeptidase [Promicromonospora sukumoe]|uniref:M15 family metallopeptidase n=1 Tax=Promicromonospora sukumoe TaxID=88382 RepID=UPI0012FCAD28|nr:M15 family metallopeptidase [Promicromonospora sukumoe]
MSGGPTGTGAAFFRDRGRAARRALTSRRARNAWTGAVALAMTGGVLVSASASVPASHPLADGAPASAAQPAAARTVEVGAASQRPATGPEATAPDGVTVSQVLAVLDRAESMLRQSSEPSPAVAQAAAELGMLYTTYQAQQLALTEADRPLRVESAPTAGEPRTPALSDEPIHATQVSRTVTGGTHGSPAPDWGTPGDLPAAEVVPEDAGEYVTFDEVAVAAMRLANMLDPSSPTALIETLPDAGTSLRRNLLDTVAAYGDSTAGYANGRIPADVLCALPFAPGHLLRCDAAERLAALSARFEKEFGHPIPITDSYRSFEMQVTVRGTKPHLAAIPGTSNHGWGLAVDLGNPIAGGASDEYVWLRLHAPDYGWDNPSWAQLGGAKPEPWHFEFFAAGSIPNRAIDPSDVGSWATVASTDPANPGLRSDGDSGGRKGSSSDGGSGAGASGSGTGGSGTGSGADAGSGSGGGSSAGSGGKTPAAPEKPTPAETSEPPVEAEPEAPAETGLVEGVVGGTLDLVGDTVDGVVGGVVGGLLGGTSTGGTENPTG